MKGIVIRGTPLVPDAQVLERLDLRAGAPYDPVPLNERLTQYTDSLRARGYYEAVVQQAIQPSPDGTTVDVTVDVQPGPSRPAFGTQRALFDAPPTRQPTRSVYVATPDGQRFLFVRERESRWRQPIVVVSDWLAGRGR